MGKVQARMDKGNKGRQRKAGVAVEQLYVILLGANIRGMAAAAFLWAAWLLRRLRRKELPAGLWAAVFLVQALPADLLLIWAGRVPPGLSRAAQGLAVSFGGLLFFLLWEAGALCCLLMMYLRRRRFAWEEAEESRGLPGAGLWRLCRLIACLHWYQPLLWLCLRQMGRDGGTNRRRHKHFGTLT